MTRMTLHQQQLLDALHELHGTLQDDYPVLSFEHRQNIHHFLVRLDRVLQDILAIPWNHNLPRRSPAVPLTLPERQESEALVKELADIILRHPALHFTDLAPPVVAFLAEIAPRIKRLVQLVVDADHD